MFHVKHSIGEQNVPRETIELVESVWTEKKPQFDKYADLLLWWKTKINLLSKRTTKEEVLKHIKHCLYVIASEKWQNSPKLIVDAGSGGGLPGIPLAIAFPEKEFVLMDVVSKKMLAADQIAKGLILSNVVTQSKSIEAFKTEEQFLYISKHAFKLKTFINLTVGQNYSDAIFLKGIDFKDELKECTEPLSVNHFDIANIENDAFFTGKQVVTISLLNE